VNATTGDGRRGDAGPRGTGFVPDHRSCRRRESFEGQQGARRGSLFRDREKRCEPHDRQRHATRPQGHGGINRRGGAKPRGRHAGWESAFPSRRRRASASRTADSAAHTMEGRIFGQPQERKPGFAAGSQGPERVGKVGAKVRRVARTCVKTQASGPVEGPRGLERGDVFEGRGGQQ
jgi:hypothetical protein